jgi:hypothetical protein
MCIKTISTIPPTPKQILERIESDKLEERKKQGDYMKFLNEVVK